MRALRIVLLLGVFLGVAILLIEENSPPPDTVPFPGTAQWVRIPLKLHSGGMYFVKIVLPTVGQPASLREQTLACEVLTEIRRDAEAIRSQRTTSIRRTGSLGFWHVDEYQAGASFRLPRGQYAVTFLGVGPCMEATQRGALITLEEDVGDPTSNYLYYLVRHGFALLLTFGGVVALLLAEMVRRPNPRLSGR